MGSIPYLGKPINRGTASREQSLGALSLWTRVPHTVQGVFESSDLAQTRNVVQP